MEKPSRAEFCQVYYDRTNDYWDIADTWGVERWQVDEWRRALGLPSRRHYGTRRPDPDPEWEDPHPRWEYFAGHQPRWWDRRRIPRQRLHTKPRRVGHELYCMVI